MSRQPRIALVGNPNSGKSTLFNELTGLNQKVANFPGVTVDKKIGHMSFDNGAAAQVIDLPGIYSIYPKSTDEEVVFDYLINTEAKNYPDLIVVVVDSSNLKRNLLLYTQIKDLQLPVILALNMTDLAEKSGIKIDVKKLEQVLGVPVCCITARKGVGINNLKHRISSCLESKDISEKKYIYEDAIAGECLTSVVRSNNSYHALLIGHRFRNVKHLTEIEREEIQRVKKESKFDLNISQANEILKRYRFIKDVVEQCVVDGTTKKDDFSSKLDKVLTHRIWGYLIFFFILLLIFQAIFSWATYPMDLIDEGIASLNNFLKETLPSGPLNDLLTDGIIAGLGGILIFIPQIAILFALISLLEETGYMSRVIFLMDKIMRKFGLNGKSVVPLISGVACAIPAVMAARNIDNTKERLITIFVTPLMSCSARIPVYTILIALVVPSEYVFGIFNLQGLTLMGLYLLGLLAALLSAYLLKIIMKTKGRSFFIMELPTYKMPRWKNVGLTIIEKVKAFVWEAGKVIMAISIILWVMASFGPGQNFNNAEQIVAENYKNSQLSQEELTKIVEGYKLEHSYAGLFGRTLEPVIKPLGFDWKIGIALITSFAAREVFVGTMSTIYSLGNTDDEQTVKERLALEKDPETGGAFFNLARSFSLLIYYAFAMQCMSTLAVVYRETNGWKWPILQLLYMTGLAYISSFVIYQLLS
ncbi:MAG TPA: ferrous iron transport protein B [Cytophagales bacterium]|nr:ferrous iron transport protein B [Cytophagales bacterium]